MNKYIFHLLIVFICVNGSIKRGVAQWTQLPTTTSTTDLRTCGKSGAFWYAGGINKFLRSFDNGNTWENLDLLDQGGNPILATILYDVHFFDSANGVATGSVATSNDEVILRTSNSGSNWSLVHVFSTGNWPREQLDFAFTSNSIGFSAGSNNRILKTTNAGVSWSLISTGISGDWESIDFYDSNNGYACGYQKIIKTSDGGSSWNQIYFGNSSFLHDIHFPDVDTGYAVGESGLILKTTTGGSTWDTIGQNLPASNYFYSVHFTSANVGYVAGSNGVYRTTDGGIYWSNWSSGDDVRDVIFSTSSDGLNAGNNGKVYATSNAGSPYSPVSYFSLNSTTNCEDSVLTTNNQSDPSWSYEWLLDSVFVSSAYNYSFSIPAGGSSHTLELVALYNGLRDTFKLPFYIQPSLDISLQTSVTNDSLCDGQSTSILVLNSESNTTYQLWNDSLLLGTQFGNQSNLTFSSGALNGTTDFHITATKTITGCGSFSTNDTVHITSLTPIGSPLTFAQDTVCKYDSTLVTLPLSENSVEYIFSANGSVIDTSVGNGGPISFYSGSLSNDAVISYGLTGITGCNANFTNPIPIIVEYAGSNFASTSFFLDPGESTDIINTSLDSVATHSWNFGSFATPSSSILTTPGSVSFSATGPQSVILTSTTSTGCLDSITKVFTVINSSSWDTCGHFKLSDSDQYDARIGNMGKGSNNDLYVMYSSANGTDFTSVGEYGDTLWNNSSLTPPFNFRSRITKYKATGVPNWSAGIQANGNIKRSDLIADSQGNLFVTYMINQIPQIQIISSDNSVDPYATVYSGQATWYPLYLTKFNKYGIHQWTTNVQEHYASPSVGISIGDSGKIYVATDFELYQFDSLGIISSTPFSTDDFTDLVIDNDGNIVASKWNQMKWSKFDQSGALIYDSPAVTGNAVIGVSDIETDVNGNIYVAGMFKNQFIFAGDTLDDPYLFGPSHADVFIARFRKNGMQDWARRFECNQASQIRGFDVSDGVVTLLVTGTDTVKSSGLFDLEFAGSGTYIFRCDTVNQTSAWSKLMDTNSWSSYGSHSRNLEKIGPDQLFVGFDFEENFNFNGINVTTHINSAYEDCVVLNLSEECAFGSAASGSPSSYFTTNSLEICRGDTFYLSGYGTNNPTSWLWTSNGGVLGDSLSQNTFITFSDSGTYQVDLQVGNANGFGVFSRNLLVTSPPTGITFGHVDTACVGDNVGIFVNNVANVDWFDGSTGSPYAYTVDSTLTAFLSAYDTPGCTFDTSITIVSIDIEPTITFLSDSILCDGDTLSLMATGIANYFYWNYDWNSTPTFSIQVPLPNGADSIFVAAEEDYFWCWHEQYVHFSMDGNSISQIVTSPNDSVCSGDTVTVSVSSTGTYVWNTGSTDSILSFPVHADSILWLTSSGVSTNCVSTDTIYITKLDSEILDYSLITDSSCSNGSSIDLTMANGNGTWSGQGVNGNFINPSNASLGFNPLYYDFINVYGCTQLDSILIYIEGNPSISIISVPDDSICYSDTIVVTGTSSGLFTWNSGLTDSTISFQVFHDTLLLASATSPFLNCLSTASHPVYVLDREPVNYSSIPDSVCSSSSPIDLTVTPSNGNWLGSGVTGLNFDPSMATVGTNILTYNFSNVNGCFQIDSIDLVVVICNSIYDVSNEESTIYPNPNSGIFSVKLTNNNLGKVELYTVEGKLVFSSEIKGEGMLDMRHLSNQMYFLKIQTKQGVEVRRIFIQK